MAKKAYYFSHDAGARNDPKMLALRAEWGVEGYGYYMIILEMMREQSEFMLEHCTSTTRALSYEFRVDSDKVETFINDCVDVGLFCISDDYIWSESFVKRMEKMTGEAVSRTKRAKKAANTRWNKKNDAKPMHEQCSSNADAMLNDANEIRLNEIRLNKIRLEEKSVGDKSPSNDSPTYKYDSENTYYKMAVYFRGKMLEYDSSRKVPKEEVKALQTWADILRKTIELDKRTVDNFKVIMRFLDHDDFWQGVIMSPKGLRKNWDKVMAQTKRGSSKNNNNGGIERVKQLREKRLQQQTQ